MKSVKFLYNGVKKLYSTAFGKPYKSSYFFSEKCIILHVISSEKCIFAENSRYNDILWLI